MKKLLLLLSLSSCAKYTIIVVQPSLNEAVVRDTIMLNNLPKWMYFQNSLPEYRFDNLRFYYPNDFYKKDSIWNNPSYILKIGVTDSIITNN